jgi:hypothetical protein
MIKCFLPVNIMSSPSQGPKQLPAVKFSSASEVTEYLKRKTSSAYYTNFPQSQKAAYASTYTTFLGANAYKLPTQEGTCVSNTTGFVQRPAKVAPGKNRWNPT